MISRWALAGEKRQLAQLWKRCFGDEETVADSFFSYFPPQDHTRIVTEGNLICAMASWIPMTLDGHSGAYLYAVATAPEFRGRGLCSALMAELEEALRCDGIAVAALCPAEPSLYDFYARLGYETAFYCKSSRFVPADQEIFVQEITAAAYQIAREAALCIPHCTWNEAALCYLAETGTHFYTVGDGCAAVQKCGQTLRVTELLAENAAATVTALCRVLHASSAEVRQLGRSQPQGMLKWLIFGQKTKVYDLGFAFD